MQEACQSCMNNHRLSVREGVPFMHGGISVTTHSCQPQASAQHVPSPMRQGMEALKEGLQAVNTTRLEHDYGVRVPVLLKAAGAPPRPGAKARERGLRPKHPVRHQVVCSCVDTHRACSCTERCEQGLYPMHPVCM